MADLTNENAGLAEIAQADAQFHPGGLATFGTFADCPKDETVLPASVQQGLAEKRAIAEGRLVKEEEVSLEPEVFQYLGFSDEGEKGDWAIVIQAGEKNPPGGSLDLLTPQIIVSLPLAKGCIFKTPSVDEHRAELLKFYRSRGVPEKKATARSDSDAPRNVRRMKYALMSSLPYMNGRLIAVARRAQEKRAETAISIREQFKKLTGQDIFAMAEKLGVKIDLAGSDEQRAGESKEPKFHAVRPPVAGIPPGIPKQARTITLPDGAH